MTNRKKSVVPLEKTIVFDRLINESEFKLVFTNGTTVISDDKKIKAKYLFIEKDKNNSSKIGISVSSKKGNSVWRNRIKRLLREAIRINRETVRKNIQQKNTDILIIFSPYSINQINSKKIFLGDIKASVLNILNRIEKQLPHTK